MNLIRRLVSKLNRAVKFRRRLRQAKSLGISFVPPNFLYRGTFDDTSTVIDAGCANDADFSIHVIQRFGVRAFGVDPTRKHAAALAELERKMNGRFKHLPYALAASPGTMTFYESTENVSGSVLRDHRNIVHDTVNAYEVEAVTPRDLLRKIGIAQCDFIKMDLEGAEYELLSGLTADDLRPFEQVFVEFHHHAFERYTTRDTERAVESLTVKGFRRFSLDDHNYLFFR